MFLLNYFEIIGTIAFAVSGAVTGIEKKLDLFGIIFLAIITSVGGGIFRDLIIGNTPPTAFVNPSAAIISIITALVVFFLYKKIHKFEKIIIISDAIGLGVFTAIGCRTAMMHGASNTFFVVAMGLITGVGGGMIRDVFVGNVPFVLKSEIYAMASIVGALFFYSSFHYIPEMIDLYLCCAIVFSIRIVAVIHKINLPTRFYEQ
jgi:uncharacterized membrane protein YeiH